ncbi:MAG TPA: AAA family ATPase [Phycisphaerae bacterium]|nr:AAA family ATPase [Phycisphaerae bacterium]
MTANEDHSDRAFEQIQQEARVARTARMLDDKKSLKANQRVDIIARCKTLIADTDYTQSAIARELGISSSTLSELLKNKWKGKNGDRHLAQLHNWMELNARRDTILHGTRFVATAVAEEILIVARTVAETCKMGVVFGPSHIGKSFTLEAIAGDQVFGCPVVITVQQWLIRPLPLIREMCSLFDLPTYGTFDALARRLVKRLTATKRMLIIDEADRLCHEAIETIRGIHDQTGCPVLFAGKPKIYERLGFRALGEFSEVTDQLASRIVMKRDLTERTRGDNPEPLYRLDDIRKLIRRSGLKLDVSPDAEKWLQARASTLGMGGIGKALFSLYLAAKVAYAKGDPRITVDHLEDVDDLAMGHEDAERIMEAVAGSSGMRRVV